MKPQQQPQLVPINLFIVVFDKKETGEKEILI